MNPPLWTLPAVELAARLRAGEVTAADALEACLTRIDEVNPRVNAIVTLDRDAARERAAALDRLPAAGRGPLHGMPIAVKDLEDTAGLRTTYGSPIFAGHVPSADALIVSRLRRAGAVIVGKTNTPEWGAGSQTFNPVFGPTRNPWDPRLTPGGSSGGAAAAVAAGMVPFADGSDMGGSIRNPAALCHLLGLRPSPGRVPALDGDPLDPLPVLGPIARSAADAALLLRVIAGPHPHAPLSHGLPALPDGPPRPAAPGARIAWSPDLGDLPLEPAVRAALEDTARPGLRAIGCVLTPTDASFPRADEAFAVLRGVGFARRFGALIETDRDRLKDTVVENTEYGLALTGREVADAVTARIETVAAMRALLEEHDALALASTQVAAFDVAQRFPREIDGVTMDDYLTWMRACTRITVTGHPAISVPVGLTADGRPVGLQLVGREGGEAALLSLAAALEAELGSLARRPPL